MPTISTGTRIVVWDWKEQPDWDAINKALNYATIKRIVPVDDTGQDCVAVVVGAKTKREAQKAWDATGPMDDDGARAEAAGRKAALREIAAAARKR